VVVGEDARELLRDAAQLEDGNVGHAPILSRKRRGGPCEPASRCVVDE
jgi:hypothetical protein